MRRTLAVAVTAALVGGAVWLTLTQRGAAPPPSLASVTEILASAQLCASPSEIGVAEPSGVAYHAAFDRLYVDHLSYQRDPFRSGLRLPEPGRTVFLTLAASLGGRARDEPRSLPTEETGDE